MRPKREGPRKASRPQVITLGHSPDADDAFMFYALARRRIATGGFRFRHILQDIQTLNERARRAELDVTAISFHAYPHVANEYCLLSCGASMGDGYGPTLVALHPRAPEELSGLRIAIPGKLTSAFLALRIFLADSKLHVPEDRFRVMAFDRIFEAIRSGRADAGLIIHEGQLTYGSEGFYRLVDLGAWWKGATGLPLPLGGNIIRKSLGTAKCRTIARILATSIRYGLDHMEEALPYLRRFARGLDDSLTRQFIRMYVNDYTMDYGRTGRRAIAEFLGRGNALGLIPQVARLEFV